tara:strand:+ start:940 stop:1386 length:447 start_codon:yes stop_codon:yes gene_type:complete
MNNLALHEIDEELDIETVLREDFDENDFLENEILKKKLKDDHKLLFQKKIQGKFYQLFMMYLDDYPNMFKNLDFDEMFEMLYTFVLKDYNIEKLYSDYENTADILLEQYKKETTIKQEKKENNIKPTILKVSSSGISKSTSWANLVKN